MTKQILWVPAEPRAYGLFELADPLADRGIQIDRALTGQQALEFAAKKPYDLMLVQSYGVPPGEHPILLEAYRNAGAPGISNQGYQAATVALIQLLHQNHPRVPLCTLDFASFYLPELSKENGLTESIVVFDNPLNDLAKIMAYLR
ncbi:hypothetical protein HZB02_02225 [Candidatus Woesearchaeota archaeon]|nr:hypothetical protein [Candidatus Woesearchaeota archaeon]